MTKTAPNPVGKPRKYKTEQELLDKARQYFELCDENKVLPDKAGLRIYVDLSKSTYGEYKEKYPDALRYIEDYIESCWARRLPYANATGPIFYLKNAFKEDFKDRVENDVTTNGESLNVGINRFLDKVYGD